MTSAPPSPLRAVNAASSAPVPPLAMKPSAPPVNILPTQLARTYSFVHLAALLAILAVRFEALVADPVAEMLNTLPFLALLQVTYVMVCLPPAGSVLSSSPVSPVGEGDEKEKEKEKRKLPLRAGKLARKKNQAHAAGLSAKLTPALLSLILTFLLATPVLAFLLVLFGAPLTTHNAETVLCAAHMALLASTALIYVHGVDGAVWREVWAFARPADAVWGGALGTALGAWLGAVPIPLDWDRPWQAFPITILTGAYIGFAVGSVVCRSSWLFGKWLEFMPEQDEVRDKKTE
ncbi:glycosylphosphatidylinositol anchor biosynthesis protein 11 [Aspergillus udagawae]|uniref:Glycosylphosphatidylinositol anchor biosynthesis protein 11 n=1 Tax=Aspergillus udagawae TaxID=91492 RepID=A0ABQ1A7Z4_9EURO|nr:glycosylphosphatidylinositol anchor biosynthesis protein 11 [Aspergillus udagawae]GFF75706.1 glycosylphosphatidylinositol anchor biosynthesis protein 11 [Aspergillus udagawae]GFG01786.1 glycosylphosphatidylinositol anchor biosynthesis protein 11 [Aspergillus udagawae]